MANVKQWRVADFLPVSGYLRNTVTSGEVVLKVRDRKGVRRSNLQEECEVAIKALTMEISRAFSWEHKGCSETFRFLIDNDDQEYNGDEQTKCNKAFESWISEYLIEGGRAKLLNAMRVREHRAEQGVEPDEVKKKDKAPVDRIAQLAKVLSKYSEKEIDLALRMIGKTLR